MGLGSITEDLRKRLSEWYAAGQPQSSAEEDFEALFSSLKKDNPVAYSEMGDIWREIQAKHSDDWARDQQIAVMLSKARRKGLKV